MMEPSTPQTLPARPRKNLTKLEHAEFVVFTPLSLWNTPCRAMSVAELKAVVEGVERLEAQEDGIQPWSEIASSQSVIPGGEMPTPGEILPDIKEYPYLGAKEITLANGMKVSPSALATSHMSLTSAPFFFGETDRHAG